VRGTALKGCGRRSVLALLVAGAFLLGGCMMQKAPVVHVNYADTAPHPMPPIQREKFFDGSLYAPGGLGDLASDDVATREGDPVIIRFGEKNGYPGIPQSRVTRMTGQVVRVEPSGSLLVSAQRTVRDGTSLRRIVLVGRIARTSLESSNEVPVSEISMLRFRSDSESGGGGAHHNSFSTPPSAVKGVGKAVAKAAKKALTGKGSGQ